MARPINLFKILGIRISIDYTWFIVFVLFAWSLAYGYYPANIPNLSLSTYIVMGVISSLSLFICVLIHELSHSYTSNRLGLDIKEITLFIFGGMAKLTREPDRAMDELKIAAAGPLAGLIPAIPLTFLGLTLSTTVNKANIPEGALHFADPLLFKALSWMALGPLNPDVEVMIHPLAYAGWVGMFVTALNLLPIGQLDGGHITHALFGSRSRLVAFAMFGGLLGFSLWEHTITWVPLLVLLFFFGIQHPHINDDGRPLGNVRVALGLLLGLVFATCFSLVPIWQ